MIHQTFNSIGTHIYNAIIYTNFSPPFNFHNSFELVYVMEGSCIITVNNTETTVKKDEFILISPNMVHKFDRNESNKYLIIVFSGDFVSEFYKNNPLSPFYKFTVDEVTGAFLKKNILFQGTPDLYKIKSCLYAICDIAISEDTNEDLRDTPQHSINHFVLSVNEYISENLNVNLTRKAIATALNYEEHYFSKLFNRCLNMGLKQYINIYRFSHAQKLLTSTNLSISQIAYDCGFSSIQSFYRIFKELSGKAPNQYRKTELLITQPDTANEKFVTPVKTPSEKVL